MDISKVIVGVRKFIVKLVIQVKQAFKEIQREGRIAKKQLQEAGEQLQQQFPDPPRQERERPQPFKSRKRFGRVRYTNERYRKEDDHYDPLGLDDMGRFGNV